MPILTNITRRFALSLGLAAAIGFSAPMPAAALATDEAERFLGGVLEDMRGLILVTFGDVEDLTKGGNFVFGDKPVSLGHFCAE